MPLNVSLSNQAAFRFSMQQIHMSKLNQSWNLHEEIFHEILDCVESYWNDGISAVKICQTTVNMTAPYTQYSNQGILNTFEVINVRINSLQSLTVNLWYIYNANVWCKTIQLLYCFKSYLDWCVAKSYFTLSWYFLEIVGKALPDLWGLFLFVALLKEKIWVEFII